MSALTLAACSDSPDDGGGPTLSASPAGAAASSAAASSGPATKTGAAATPRVGTALQASGGWRGSVPGPFSCSEQNGFTILRDPVAISTGLGLTLTARAKAVVSGSLLGNGRTFGGASVTGLPGSLTISGGKAVVKGVNVPALGVGKPVVLNGVVACRA